ncbi:hypothetical protein BX600DRAFT_428583 [Xylariales sp. PMI_506]|nr:hypothetical protein BX600DRAFT_428583 [Xylariales sp. PMI_506]
MNVVQQEDLGKGGNQQIELEAAEWAAKNGRRGARRKAREAKEPRERESVSPPSMQAALSSRFACDAVPLEPQGARGKREKWELESWARRIRILHSIVRAPEKLCPISECRRWTKERMRAAGFSESRSAQLGKRPEYMFKLYQVHWLPVSGSGGGSVNKVHVGLTRSKYRARGGGTEGASFSPSHFYLSNIQQAAKIDWIPSCLEFLGLVWFTHLPLSSASHHPLKPPGLIAASRTLRPIFNPPDLAPLATNA